MNERIKKLTELTLSGQMYATPTKTTFDEADLHLPRQQMESKRICEYILNQEPKLTEYSCLTGFFNFDGSVVGDAFRRGGHAGFDETRRLFYVKTVDNLSTFEWQHATADYTKILSKGIGGIIKDIDNSLTVHDDPEQVEFLHRPCSPSGSKSGWEKRAISAMFSPFVIFAKGIFYEKK